MTDKNLEEITIHEINRIGHKLENDLKLLKETKGKYKQKGDKELNEYVNVYLKKITDYNNYVREINLYIPDSIVKFYRNILDDKLSYIAKKRHKIGFVKHYI